MEFLALIFIKILDPIGLVVCFVLLLKLRHKWWSIPLAALASAVASETILAGTQITRNWGDGLGNGIIGGLAQAALICGLFKLKERLKENDKKPPESSV